MNPNVTFEDLGISADILEALEKKGFVSPTPVQAQTIPLLLHGEKDIVAQAQTGTGKTAAFGIPILERIQPGLKKVQAIVLVPTRELASQVAEELETLKAGRNIRILPVYGGQGMDVQLRQLKQGVDIVVATPGRAIDHLNRKTLKLDNVRFAVLDEADEMLNMGFVEDIETILEHAPDQRRMLLFSATMPSRILDLAKKFMGEYDKVSIQSQQKAAANVEQVYYEIAEEDKLRALRRLMDTEKEFYSLVFCRTRIGADRLAEKLSNSGFDVEALHGDVSQVQRERILDKFKGGRATILVATDVAARGIDVNNLTHVINFDLPDSPESYVHRIGRTGRAGKLGKAITFVTPGEFRRFNFILQINKAPVRRGVLPSGETVVELKRNHIIEQVNLAAETPASTEFHAIAQEILSSGKPKQILAALLQQTYGTQLNASAYPEIREPQRRQLSRDPRMHGHKLPPRKEKFFPRKEKDGKPKGGEFWKKKEKFFAMG